MCVEKICIKLYKYAIFIPTKKVEIRTSDMRVWMGGSGIHYSLKI